MNELDTLRTLREEVTEPTRDKLTPAFDRLNRAMSAPSRRRSGGLRRPRRRAAAWAGFSALGATTLTVTLIATNVLGVPGSSIGADPAAASTLESAAVATLEASDLVVNPGQYLRVRTDAVFAAAASESVSLLENYHDELYVPADRNDDWWRIQCERTLHQTFGPESEAFAEEIYEPGSPSGVLRRLPGGAGTSGVPSTGYRGDYDALPRDPRQLLDTIYDYTSGAGRSRDGQALVWISDTLRGGTVPAEVRASLYKAAALIPGVMITEAQATLNGTTGVAIGRVETADNTRQDVIIDPATGQVIGEREVALASWNGLPAGTAIASSAVTTTVVDAAPTDVSTCGVRE